MIMRLDLHEVQTAVIEYLRTRGVVVEHAHQVQLEIVNNASGAQMSIAGCSAVVFASNVKLPEGAPYR